MAFQSSMTGGESIVRLDLSCLVISCYLVIMWVFCGLMEQCIYRESVKPQVQEIPTLKKIMEFGKGKREKSQNARKNRQKRLAGDDRNRAYRHRLQFYSIPPTENISLHEFEEMAINRLKVLKQVENIGIKFVKGRSDYKDVMEKELRKLMPIAVSQHHNDEDDYDEKRQDHISHFILRLAYCRSEELRRWFIAQELDLFRFRFLQESKKKDSITNFLQENDLHYKPISEEEKKDKSMKFCKSSYGINQSICDEIDFYKVPFTEALDLVKGRKVYLEKGFAYVPHNDLVSIVVSAFRAHLSHALALTARAVPSLEEDNRLLPMLTNISKQYLGEDYSNKNSKTGSIDLEEIDNLAKKAYPLCMRQLHSALREDHHLKHGGRQQYGLFLKGIGLTMEQALTFWRKEFTQKMDAEKFEKQYAYNIRHSFGKEGKRVNYTPYSCMKIIMGTQPGPGDHHGCPFRHTDVKLLKQRLASYKIPAQGIEQVADLVKGYHYQLACTKYFELTHNIDKDEVSGLSLQHPNQYFDASMDILSGKLKESKGGKFSQGNNTSGNFNSQRSSGTQSSSQSQMSSTQQSANTSTATVVDEEGWNDFTAEDIEKLDSSAMDTS